MGKLTKEDRGKGERGGGEERKFTLNYHLHPSFSHTKPWITVGILCVCVCLSIVAMIYWSVRVGVCSLCCV